MLNDKINEIKKKKEDDKLTKECKKLDSRYFEFNYTDDEEEEMYIDKGGKMEEEKRKREQRQERRQEKRKNQLLKGNDKEYSLIEENSSDCSKILESESEIE